MPTYEYRCTACDYYFEKFQSIKAEPVKKCPRCGQPVKKLLSGGAGLIFKGSGFYITDYKKSNTSPSNGNNGNGKHATESKTETKSPESKKTAEHVHD